VFKSTRLKPSHPLLEKRKREENFWEIWKRIPSVLTLWVVFNPWNRF